MVLKQIPLEAEVKGKTDDEKQQWEKRMNY